MLRTLTRLFGRSRAAPGGGADPWADLARPMGGLRIVFGGWRDAVRPLPDGHVAVAVGDVHGEADMLAAMHDLLHRLRHDALPAEQAVHSAALIHLGDLIDRGPASFAALRLARDGVPGFETVTLIGNHEERLLELLDAGDPAIAEAWLGFGGDAVLRELGLRPQSDWLAQMRATVDADLVAWLAGRPRRHRIGALFFVHAGIDPARPLDAQTARDLVWIRRPFLDSTGPYPEAVAVIHGHTPTPRVDLDHPHRINIDSGAHGLGRLSALLVTGKRMRLIQVVDPSRSAADA